MRYATCLAVLVALNAAGPSEGARAPVTLVDVTVTAERGETAIHIKTAGPPSYRTEVLDTPARLVIDIDPGTYRWGKDAVAVAVGPIRRIRGWQHNASARIVLDLSSPTPHVVRQGDDGLTIVFPRSTASARATSATPIVAAMAGAAAREPHNSSVAPASASSRGAGFVRLVQAQAPSTPTPAAPAPAPGQRLISFDFKDADVVNLLRILAAESGKNIVIGEDVKGKMSISLRNVPWEQALDTILEARGLQKIERDNVIRIVSDEQLAKEREARARVEESKVKAEVDIRTKLAEAELKEQEAQQRKFAQEAAVAEAQARGPLSEAVIRLSYADPGEIANTLQGILALGTGEIKPCREVDTERGTVKFGVGGGAVSGPIAEPPFSQLFGPPQQQTPERLPMIPVVPQVSGRGLVIRAHCSTNTLFLRLYAADLERIRTLVRESLDVPLPQVKIEARMEILDRNALEQIGIQWGGAFVQGAGSQTVVGRGFEQGPIPSGIPTPGFRTANSGLTLENVLPVSAQTGLPLGGNLVNLPISSLPNAGPLPAAGIAFGIVGTRFNVNLALQALAQQGKTRTLARPEIVTVENSKATISLGEEIPYATVSSAGTQIQFKEALLKLDVTPTVIREGAVNRIKMIVVVENNSRGAVVNLGGSGSPPAIDKRRAETQVLMNEGDRLIIGGVATSQNQNTERKVPLLGDVPILGHLFKIRESFETGRELVVFLTPSILRSPVASAVPPPPPPPAR